MQASKEVKITDVTPLSLGTDTHDGSFKVIIPRNTLIPAEKSATFTTVTNNQTSILSKILEGERLLADDNNLLGEMFIGEIPEMPKGVPNVEFTFKVENDGFLHVSAIETVSGINADVRIKYDQRRLNKTQLDQIIEEAAIFREEDEKKKHSLQAKNDLKGFCHFIEEEIEHNIKLSDEDMKKIVSKCEKVLEWLEADELYEKEQFIAMKRELEELFESVKNN